jgi:hypothetical protein
VIILKLIQEVLELSYLRSLYVVELGDDHDQENQEDVYDYENQVHNSVASIFVSRMTALSVVVIRILLYH